MKLKLKELVWKQSTQRSNEQYAMLNERILFEVRTVGKKNPVYEILSYPPETGILTRANNSKKLSVHPSFEEAKLQVEDYYKKLVLFFTEEIK